MSIDVERDVERIREAQARHNFVDQARILTSRDEDAIAMMNELASEGLQPGFEGRMIPIVFYGPGTESDVEASVGATTELHSHSSEGFHQILTGTVRVSGEGRQRAVELTAGDWVYVPANVDYTIEIVENPAKLRYRHR